MLRNFCERLKSHIGTFIVTVLSLRVKKIIAISFLLIYLLGNTDLGEVLNFSSVITHFHQHEKLNPRLNFVQFLVMHYAGDDGTTTDNQQDNELPFKHPHPPFSVVTNGIPSVVTFITPPFKTNSADNNFIYDHTSICSGYLLQQLRPPC